MTKYVILLVATVLEFRPALRMLLVICTIYCVLFTHTCFKVTVYCTILSVFFTLDLILLRVTKLFELLFGCIHS